MTENRPKRPADLNQLAATIVGESVGEPLEIPKNEARAKAGRLGGQKGGHARAAKLTRKKLSEIGKKGAKARWADPQESAESSQVNPTSHRA